METGGRVGRVDRAGSSGLVVGQVTGKDGNWWKGRKGR